jgi:hypothetical protein
MGKAKLKKKLGIRHAQKTITVGIVATRWDAYPDVPVATTMFTMPIHDMKKLRAAPLDKGGLVQQIGEGFVTGRNGEQDFALLCAAYVAKTQTFALAVEVGFDGIWMKLLSRAGNHKARPYGLTNSDEIVDLMSTVRGSVLTNAERLEWVYSTHPDDVSIIGLKLT